MDEFRNLIEGLAKVSGLPMEVDEKNSVTLEYSDFIITLQYLEDPQTIFIYSPLTGSEMVENVTEAAMRSALILSFGGLGTSGNFLGLFDDFLVLSRHVGINGLDEEKLSKYIFDFAQNLESVRNEIVNEVMNTRLSDFDKHADLSSVGLNV